jgi:uncharacterized protein (DUF1778 family)
MTTTLSPAAWAELMALLERQPTELPPALNAAAISYRDAVASGRLVSQPDLSWIGSAAGATAVPHDLGAIRTLIASGAAAEHQIELTAEEFTAFLRIIDDDAQPDPELVAAARRYHRESVGHPTP